MRRIFLLVAALAGCAHGAARAPIAPTDPATLTTDGPAPLVWSKVRGDTAIEFLMANVSIAGYTTPLLVDTGANATMLESGLAWYLGLDRTTARTTTVQGAHGDETEGTFLSNVSLHILGFPPIAPQYVFLGDMPVRSRLMGFLSPQALVGDGAARIDFAHATMASVPKTELDTLAARPGAVRAKPECPTKQGVALFVVDVEVDGKRVPLVVDSGSGSTSLFGQTEVGRVLAQKAGTTHESSAAIGSVESATIVPGVKVVAAGGEARVQVSMIDRPPAGHCSASEVVSTSVGTLGIDFLKRCVFVVSAGAAVLWCG